MNKLLTLGIFSIFLFISLVFAVEIGDDSRISGVTINKIEAPAFNNFTGNVNSSDRWNTLDRGLLRNVADIQGSWITNDLGWITETDGNASSICSVGDILFGSNDGCRDFNASVELKGDSRYIRNNFDNNYIALLENATLNDGLIINADRGSQDGIVCFGAGVGAGNTGCFIEFHSNTGGSGTDETVGFMWVTRDIIGGDLILGKTKFGNPTILMNFETGATSFSLGDVLFNENDNELKTVTKFTHNGTSSSNFNDAPIVVSSPTAKASAFLATYTGINGLASSLTSGGNMFLLGKIAIFSVDFETRLDIDANAGERYITRFKGFDSGATAQGSKYTRISNSPAVGDEIYDFTFRYREQSGGATLDFARVYQRVLQLGSGLGMAEWVWEILDGAGSLVEVFVVGLQNSTLQTDFFNVTGNITSQNVFIPQYIFPHTDATIPLISINVWENITFDQETTDIKFGISHTFNDDTNHSFTINEDGVYSLEYDFDVVDTSPSASDINTAGRVIFENGTEILGSAFETDIVKQQIETQLSHSFLAKFNSGDKIIFQFTADDIEVLVSTHGTFGDHPDSATIIIEKVANL